MKKTELTLRQITLKDKTARKKTLPYVTLHFDKLIKTRNKKVDNLIRNN